MGDYIAPNRFERKILVAVGAGAGLAAAFNAPLAGIFFVVEELQHSINQLVLVTAFAACVTADIVCRALTGELPVFHVSVSHYPTILMVPFFIMLGVFLGFGGLLFNSTLLKSSAYIKKIDLGKKLLFAASIGIVFGLIGLISPMSLGTGGDLITHIFNHNVVVYQLVLFFIIRFVFTMASYSTGAPGGIFAPLLLLGMLAGSVFGYMAIWIYPGASFDFSVWGILGMAGFFSAIVRAPITGIVLILEMTNAHSLLLPLMIVSIISYGIPEYFKDKPVYDALLQQDLSQKSIKSLSVQTE